MFPVLSAAAVLLALLLLYRLILTSGRTITPFNPTRATRIGKPSGNNALLILAAVNVAALAYQLTAQAAIAGPDIATAAGIMLPPLILLALAGLVLHRAVADLLLGLTGTAAALADAYLQHAATGVVVVITLTLPILYLLGILRGFISPHR